MYYKIVSDGEIVDVASGGLNFVRYQARLGAFLGCVDETQATGIVSSDGATIYLLEGADAVGDLAYVTYNEIDEDTYNELRAQLIENGVIADEVETASSSDEGAASETVAKSEMLKQIESLQEQVEMLTAALLEMSEAVYG